MLNNHAGIRLMQHEFGLECQNSSLAWKQWPLVELLWSPAAQQCSGNSMCWSLACFYLIGECFVKHFLQEARSIAN